MFKKALILFCALSIMPTLSFSQEKVIKVTVSSPTYDEAIELAKESNKKIFLLFYGEFCGPCNSIKEELMKPEVLKVLDSYVVCYVDLVKEKELRQTYKVKSVPTFFIIDKDQTIIKKESGYKSSDYLINWLTKSVLVRD
jgi:thiol-disulfide isomerase/thioredoxin